jgi:outer membrane protein OmpA-like peptidoglycan-associated protein
MKHFLTCLLGLVVIVGAHLSADTGTTAQNSVELKFSSSTAYYLVERSNWTKYVNGTYTGLTHRETRANVSATGVNEKGIRFKGFFYVLEETVHDASRLANPVDEIVKSDFTVTPSGKLIFQDDSGFPQMRDFPVYPDTSVKQGDRWQYEGFRSIDPKNDGKRSVLPIEVEYTFIGPEKYLGKDVFRIKAKYATRLNKYSRPKTIDQNLVTATGTHDVDILVDAETGATILILDRLDETFFYTDGGSVRFKGNTAIFTETPVLIVHETLIPEIASIAQKVPDSARKVTKPVDDVFSGTDAKSPVAPPVTSSGTAASGTTASGATASGTMSSAAPNGAATNGKNDIVNQNLIDPGASSGDKKAFTIEDSPQGIKLSVRDLRFEPDSDTILSDEMWRLDAIAKTLLLVKGGHFLIEGHTAAVGKPAGELELSVRRAKKVADELAKRGLLSEQFIFTGYGGTRPLADNATAEGRALNRRVEITILE